MKVFFAASTTDLEKNFFVYKLICKTISDCGHELTRDWLDEAREVVKNNLQVDYEEMYEDIITSILYSDLGIVEGTLKGLSTGHQMTIALQKGKPLLYLHRDDQEDRFPFVITGVNSELFLEKKYSSVDEIPEIVKSFLEQHKKGTRIRFNLVLTQQENQYIEWASFMYKKSKTEIIREMISSRMLADINYKRLSGNKNSS